MNEERLQEIKDSVDFQREMLLAHNLGTLCVDEEQELIDEIERLKEQLNDEIDDELKQSEIMVKKQEEIQRLNNIINELEKWVVESIEKYTEDYLDWKYDRNVYLAGSKKLQNVFDKLQELKGSDKE